MDCTHVLSYDCLSGLLQGGVTPPCTNTFRKYYRQYRIIEQE